MSVSSRNRSKSMLVTVKDETIKRALVGLAIEKALLDIGRPVFEQVACKLELEHHVYIFDCYEKPELLYNVLKELYGSSYKAIAESISKNLEEFSYQAPIRRFVNAISVS